MAKMSAIMTTYRHIDGTEHHAVQITWEQVTEILGHEHDGSAEDDARLVEHLGSIGAPAWVADAEGWTDEHVWGLIGPPKRVSYEVIEDNGGGLHLTVFDGNGNVIFYANGYEHMPADSLRTDIEALRNGDNTDGWETNGMTREEMQEAYDSLTAHEHGWSVVADNDGIYYERMGAAAMLAFGIEGD